MTASQLHDARSLIPGAYELNAPPHRFSRTAPALSAISSGEAPPRAASGAAAHVVVASPRPTTRLAQAVSILGDLALLMAMIYGVAVVPALVVWGVKVAAVFVGGTFGPH